MLAGTVRLGAVVSLTVTVKDFEPVFPCASVAVQLTEVVPSPNVVPDAGEQLTGIEPLMLSFAEAENETTAPPGPVASTEIGAGTVTVGGIVSCTVTENEPESVFPCASVAVHVTFVAPKPNVLPDDGVQVGEIDPSTMSDADAEKLTTAPARLVASTVTPPGTLTTGGVVSFTVTWKSTVVG